MQEVINVLEEIEDKYKNLVKIGCRKDISIEERINIRKELAMLRRTKKLLKQGVFRG